MKSFDVIIIGAGLAGLQCARLLAKEKVSVLLVDRKEDLTKGVHTTGIFVRKTFEDFGFPPETLGKAISDVTLYSPTLKSFQMTSDKEEFRVGKMGVLYEKFLEDCIELGVEFMSGTRYVSVKTERCSDHLKSPFEGGLNFHIDNILPILGYHTTVNLEKEGEKIQIKTKVLIGADGAKSRVAKDLGLDENEEYIVGFEEVYKGVPLTDEPMLHCFLDAELSPGYLAWITNDGEDCHIGVGGYPSIFKPRKALKMFKKKTHGKFVDLKNAELSETRGGRIPVGGVLRNIANEYGLLIGDAAGAVSPLTAGGLDPCMRLSKFASEVVLERLKMGDSRILLKYSGEMFRTKFTTRLWLRSVLKTLNNQTLLELGFKFLRGRIGRRIAEKIFFRRSSFPDIELLKEESEIGLKNLTTDLHG
jgi:flavin-dependent dehydrogenase